MEGISIGSDLELIGSSPAMRTLHDDINAAAQSDAKVLITGETGVGKDVTARLIHQRSRRRGARMAMVNCAGLPDSLLESELFGHVRGSFTGAYRDKPGLLESAPNGTVFLDEVGDMSARMQAALLRFLETGELQRVGADRGKTVVNVRLIAATNRDLAVEVEAGRFRQDLYYRLNVIHLHVAPLRERREDVPALANHFLRTSTRHRTQPVTLSVEALDFLAAQDWPGNIRQLRNVIERSVIRARGPVIGVADLPQDLRRAPAAVGTSTARDTAPESAAGQPPGADLLARMVDDGESFWSVVHEPFMRRDLARCQLRALVARGLEQTRGNYRMLVELFNMPTEDYRRFMSFLRKFDCRLPFQAFRVVQMRSPFVSGGSAREAAAM